MHVMQYKDRSTDRMRLSIIRILSVPVPFLRTLRLVITCPMLLLQHTIMVGKRMTHGQWSFRDCLVKLKPFIITWDLISVILGGRFHEQDHYSSPKSGTTERRTCFSDAMLARFSFTTSDPGKPHFFQSDKLFKSKVFPRLKLCILLDVQCCFDLDEPTTSEARETLCIAGLPIKYN